MKMKIALGADHGGYELKKEILSLLKKEGHTAVDLGTHSMDSCDYPEYAYAVAKEISLGKADRGILICKSGNGMVIVANKLPRVRAVLCHDVKSALLSRRHNDANVLVIGSEMLKDEPEEIVQSWLGESFEGGRHQRRVDQILDIEKKIFLKNNIKT